MRERERERERRERERTRERERKAFSYAKAERSSGKTNELSKKSMISNNIYGHHRAARVNRAEHNRQSRFFSMVAWSIEVLSQSILPMTQKSFTADVARPNWKNFSTRQFEGALKRKRKKLFFTETSPVSMSNYAHIASMKKKILEAIVTTHPCSMRLQLSEGRNILMNFRLSIGNQSSQFCGAEKKICCCHEKQKCLQQK